MAIGASGGERSETHLPFSVLNRSQERIELLPPQIELIGKTVDGKRIRSEPIAVSSYEITARQLGPGQRADGLVVFERPSFKQSSEHLELMIARADQVDRPVSLPVEFTPQESEPQK